MHDDDARRLYDLLEEETEARRNLVNAVGARPGQMAPGAVGEAGDRYLTARLAYAEFAAIHTTGLPVSQPDGSLEPSEDRGAPAGGPMEAALGATPAASAQIGETPRTEAEMQAAAEEAHAREAGVGDRAAERAAGPDAAVMEQLAPGDGREQVGGFDLGAEVAFIDGGARAKIAGAGAGEGYAHITLLDDWKTDQAPEGSEGYEAGTVVEVPLGDLTAAPAVAAEPPAETVAPGDGGNGNTVTGGPAARRLGRVPPVE